MASAATRPRYGGTLRVQMRAWTSSLDPAEPGEALARERLAPLQFDRLIRLNTRGEPEPALAVSWQLEGKRWQFRLRAGVRFHDGAPLTPTSVAQALEGAVVQEDSVLLPADRPLVELARPRHSIWKRAAAGALAGTGPFRLAQFEAGRRAVFTANDDYWGGRPFLDTVQVEMGRSGRERVLDLELNRAEVVELAVGEARRIAPGRATVWTSQPVELMAIVFAALDPAKREALALSIDRPSIHAVLLERQGQIAAGLLPQWLSGYAFLFPTGARVLGRAPAALSLAYDPLDPTARAVAERIAVNAREAGLTVRAPVPGAPADARLVRVRISALDPADALIDVAAALGLPAPARPASLETAYAAERSLVDGWRVVPLFHLPDVWALSPRVRNWKPSAWGEWTLEDVWLAEP